jgi:hypothetical protein
MSRPSFIEIRSWTNEGNGPTAVNASETILDQLVIAVDSSLLPAFPAIRLDGVYRATVNSVTLNLRLDATGDLGNGSLGTLVGSVTLPIATYPTPFSYEAPNFLDFTGISYIKLSAFRDGVSGAAGIGYPTITILSRPPPVVPTLKEVELLAQDSVLMTFSQPMLNDSFMQAVSSYTITPDDGGQAVTIRDVMTPSTITTDSVVLAFSPPTLGGTYTLTVSSSIRNADKIALGAPTTHQFVCRLTKMDHVLKNLPGPYTNLHRSTLRNLLQALSRVDEKIGGNRNDTFHAEGAD